MRHRPNHRGFTLIEILTVVGVIIILVGIGIAIGPEVISKGEEQLTKTILRNCEAILQEYYDRTGVLPNNVDTYPRDLTKKAGNFLAFDDTWDEDWKNTKLGDTDPNVTMDPNRWEFAQSTVWASAQDRSIKQFFEITSTVKEIQTTIYSVLPESVIRGGAIYDGWGNKIMYVKDREAKFSGHDSWTGYDVNADTWSGNARQWSPFTFLQPHDGPFFVSAGRDGAWGNYNGDQTAQDNHSDNLYSYDLED